MNTYDITVEEVKQRLNLHLDISDKDSVIEENIKEALVFVSDYIDRPLTDLRCRDKDDIEKLAYPLRAAVIMLVGDLLENLESQQSVVLNQNQRFYDLMKPYRKWGV